MRPRTARNIWQTRERVKAEAWSGRCWCWWSNWGRSQSQWRSKSRVTADNQLISRKVTISSDSEDRVGSMKAYIQWSEDIVDGSAAKNATESEAMQCSKSSGTSANVFSTLEPKQSVFKNEGKSHHMKYYAHFTAVVLCDGFHLFLQCSLLTIPLTSGFVRWTDGPFNQVG